MAADRNEVQRLPSKRPEWLMHLINGAAAGLVSDACVHPVDTIRARLQVQRGTGAQVLKYRNTPDAFVKVVSTEGWKALYRGFGIVALFTVPAHAFYFCGYELTKRALYPSRHLDSKGPVVHFSAGLVAEVLGALLWTPMDVVKQRLQVNQPSAGRPTASDSLRMLRHIAATEGIRHGLYRGFGAGLAVYGPFVGIYFVAYEKFKALLHHYTSPTTTQGQPVTFAPPFIQHLVSGASAGALAAAVTCPLDVIKTRIQVQSAKDTSRYVNFVDALRRMKNEEGWWVFTKGLGARVLWIAPGTAITIAAYEWFKKLFHIE